MLMQKIYRFCDDHIILGVGMLVILAALHRVLRGVLVYRLATVLTILFVAVSSAVLLGYKEDYK